MQSLRTCRGHDSVPSVRTLCIAYGKQHGDLDYLLADIIKHCGLRDTVPELRKKLLANLMLGSPNGGKKVRLCVRSVHSIPVETDESCALSAQPRTRACCASFAAWHGIAPDSSAFNGQVYVVASHCPSAA